MRAVGLYGVAVVGNLPRRSSGLRAGFACGYLWPVGAPEQVSSDGFPAERRRSARSRVESHNGW